MDTTSLEIAQMDSLLDLICVQLQPTPTQYHDAETKYGTVGHWLSAPGSGIDHYVPDVYPQGSFRIGTLVRPLTRLEYDVDLVCELQIDYRKASPMVVYGLIERRLQEHQVYRTMLERKNRCLRLNYAGEFHLDILPACPDPAKGGTAIMVPDRDARCWKTSNPKGYAAWFGQRGARLLSGLKAVDPLPAPQPADAKTPLQRGVQLIKRQRDVAFGPSDAAPRSIVLTTLAGRFYQGEPTSARTVTNYLDQTVQLASQSVGPFIVTNPTNSDELLSEKWRDDPSSYDAFIKETKRFARLWKEVCHVRGLQAIADRLKLLFGEELVTKAVKDYAQKLAESRQTGVISTLSKSSLIIGGMTGSRQIPRNTFYGRNPEA